MNKMMKNQKLYGATNVPFEFPLMSKTKYDDIFNEVDVDVIFSGSEGDCWKLPAFWAGDNVFRVRFAASKPGIYKWKSQATNTADSGLNDCCGEIEICEYDGIKELYNHGRINITSNGRTLEHADGKPFLWLGDTWWFGLSKRLDWPEGFKKLTVDRVQKGFNVIQIVAGPMADFDIEDEGSAWDPLQANEAGWAWEEDFTRINPEYYNMADLKISHLVENGLIPCIVGMWGYWGLFMGVDKVKKHWRNIVARYGAYPVVWCLAGETILPTYSHHSWSRKPELYEYDKAEQSKIWAEIGRYVRDIDPFKNIITSHPSTSIRNELPDDSIPEIDMIQTGHSGVNSLKPTYNLTVASITRLPRKPVLNSEVNYEGIMGSSWQEIQRFNFWMAMLMGSCGHTYGSQGIWTMNTPEVNYVGFTGSWGDYYWKDAMNFEGSKQVGLAKKFLNKYPWWMIEPREEPGKPAKSFSAFSAGIPGALIIVYIPATFAGEELAGMNNGKFTEVAPIQIEKGASYQAFYLNPRTCTEVYKYQGHGFNRGKVMTIEMGEVTPNEDGFWISPPKPSMEDWVLVLENSEELDKINNKTKNK